MGLGLILGDMIYLTAVILGLAFVAPNLSGSFHDPEIRGRGLPPLHRLETLDGRASCHRT